MRRVAYLRWLAPVLAVFLVAGCGGVLTSAKLKPKARTLTHARFVYLANRACASDIRITRNFKTPRSHEMYDRELRAETRSAEHLIFVLRGLAPPAADAAALRHMLAPLNLEDLIAHHLLDAGDQGQVERVNTLFKRGRIADRRFESRAKKLGLHVCAKD
jgi:hypothetical protein